MNDPIRVDLERLVLGSLICAAGRGIESLNLLPSDFSGNYERIFAAIKSLSEKGVESDACSILTELGGPGNGIASALADLNNSVVSGVNLGYYAGELKEAVYQAKRKELNETAALKIRTGENPDSVIADLSGKVSDLRERYKDSENDHSLSETCNELLKIAEERKPIKNIVKTRLKAVDDLCGGLIPGDYIVLAARPSIGKTALALNIAANHANQGNGVCFVSLEMMKNKIGSRLIAMISRVNTKMLLRNPAEISEDEAAQMIEASHMIYPVAEKIDLYDRTGPEVGAITQAIKSSVRRGASLVILDYLQLMNCPGENRNQQVSALSRWFKATITALNVPGIALCQLSRESEKEKRPPRMSDLRDSGSIEQDADVIWFLHREGESELVKIIQAKGRDVGVGWRELMFRRDTQTFHDLERRA